MSSGTTLDPRRWRTRAGRAAALIATMAVTMSACAGGDDAARGASATADAAGGDARSAEVNAEVAQALTATSAAATSANLAADQASAGAGAPSNEVPKALQPLDIGRSIIFTATVNVQVDSVSAASDAALSAIAGVGGFLYGQQSSNEPVPTSVLTFKVAPDRFQDALRRLGGLGTILDQQVSTDDVTGQVVDLRSRIQAAEISVERLRNFLAEAGDVTALASLERELLARETELETLRGQLRSIEAQVDLATITLTLTQEAPAGPAVEILVTAYAGDDLGDGGTAACPGDDQLQVRERERLTACYELRNVGSVALGQLRLDDPGLQLSRDELRVIDGDLGAVLAPGDSVMLVAAVSADPDRRINPRLRVVALDAGGEPTRAQVTTTVTAVDLGVEADDGPPSFGRSIAAGWGALGFVAQLALAVVGVLLPFIWIVPLALLAWRWWGPRRRARREAAARSRSRAVIAASVPGAVFPGSTPSGEQPTAAAAPSASTPGADPS